MIDQIFPAAVRTFEANPDTLHGTLLPEEEALIAHAVPKRRAEFTAGRLCARRVLESFGFTNVPILSGDKRQPFWPEGIVGSITHADGYCAAALGRAVDIDALGVDVECINRLHSELWERICRPEELTWLMKLPEQTQQAFATLIFSAKECLYKCQYPKSGAWLEFQDVTITADPASQTFEGRFEVNAGTAFPDGTLLRGRYLFHEGYVLTGITIERDSREELGKRNAVAGRHAPLKLSASAKTSEAPKPRARSRRPTGS